MSSQRWFPAHHCDLEVACPKATSRSLMVPPGQNHKAAGPPSGWHLYRFVCLSRCCLLRGLLRSWFGKQLLQPLGSVFAKKPGTAWEQLSKPFGGKWFFPASLAWECNNGGCQCNVTLLGVTAPCGTQNLLFYRALRFKRFIQATALHNKGKFRSFLPRQFPELLKKGIQCLVRVQK